MQILSANIGVQIKPVFHFQTMEIGQILALKSECAKKSTVTNNCEKWKRRPIQRTVEMVRNKSEQWETLEPFSAIFDSGGV